MAGYYRTFLRQDNFWDAYHVDSNTHSRADWAGQESSSEEAKPKTDRRHHPRQGVSCRVDYADSGRFAGVGLIKNVSIDGMFMEYVPDLAIGDTVTAAFRLPGSPPFRLKAMVKWVHPAGAGLQLVGLSRQITSLFSGNLEDDCISIYRLWLAQN